MDKVQTTTNVELEKLENQYIQAKILEDTTKELADSLFDISEMLKGKGNNEINNVNDLTSAIVELIVPTTVQKDYDSKDLKEMKEMVTNTLKSVYNEFNLVRINDNDFNIIKNDISTSLFVNSQIFLSSNSLIEPKESDKLAKIIQDMRDSMQFNNMDGQSESNFMNNNYNDMIPDEYMQPPPEFHDQFIPPDEYMQPPPEFYDQFIPPDEYNEPIPKQEPIQNNDKTKDKPIETKIESEPIINQNIKESKSIPIEDVKNVLVDTNIVEALSTLRSNDKPIEAEQIEILTNKIDQLIVAIENNTSKIDEMVKAMESMNNTQKAITSLNETKNSFNETKDEAKSVKNSISNVCSNMVQNFKVNGTKALDNTVKFTHIDKVFDSLNNKLNKDIASLDKAIEHCNKISIEAKSIGKHTSNLFKAVLGKEVSTKEVTPSEKFVKPLTNIKRSTIRWQKSTEKVVKKFDDLSEKAEQYRAEKLQIKGTELNEIVPEPDSIESVSNENVVEKISSLSDNELKAIKETSIEELFDSNAIAKESSLAPNKVNIVSEANKPTEKKASMEDLIKDKQDIINKNEQSKEPKEKPAKSNDLSH